MLMAVFKNGGVKKNLNAVFVKTFAGAPATTVCLKRITVETS